DTTSRTATNPAPSTARVFRTFQRRRPSVNPLRRVSALGIPMPLRSSARSTACDGPSETRNVPSPDVTIDQPEGSWSRTEGRAGGTPPSSGTATLGGVRGQPARTPAAKAQQISAPRGPGTVSPLGELGRRGRGERRRRGAALRALHLARALEHDA